MLDDGNGSTGDVFRRLGIEQAAGDRLLLLCTVPGRARLPTAQAA
jgi:hypothetical protein